MFASALLLAACQPAPVDPAFDEEKGAALLAKYEAARADADFEIAEMHANELAQRHGETKAAAAMRRTVAQVRAQAEAMRELAMRNVVKPQQMRDGYTSMPRNGTPAALFETLLAEFKGVR